MFPIRVKVCQESDLRMLGSLARNIQRVLPVTQADIDAAAALGKGWVVWKVIEVNDPLDNLRGGTQLVIKQNSVQPGQNVRRVIFVSGPGGETVVIGPAPSPLLLPDAIANSLQYVKAYGGTEQNGTPTPDAPMDIISNNGVLKARHQSGLPLGYTLLDYIESTGTQYIDTGYFFTDIATETVTIDFMRTGTGAGSLLYGTRRAYKDNGYAIQFQDGGNTYIQYGEIDNGLGSQNKGSLNTRYTLTQTGHTYNFNGGSYTSTGATPTQSYPLYLFTTNNGGRPSSFTPMRAYSFVIKDSNNNIKLNLVPAKNSSNVAGMYDFVSGQFFTNAGTGTFTAGSPVSDPIEIYTDGTVETINAHGKNLFDPTKVLFGYYRDRTTGAKTQNANNFMSSDDGYIPCLPNTTYTFVGTDKTNGTYSKYNTIYFFDSAKNYLGASPYDISQPTTGTTPSNCRYLQVRSNPLDNSTPIQDAFAQFNWQLERGSTATTYEPYFNGGTATAEMLLKVGDYQDVQSIIDGVVTRNVGVLVLDGTEDWQHQGTNTNLFSYQTGIDAVYPSTAICTHYIGVISSTTTSGIQNGRFKYGYTNSLDKIYIRDNTYNNNLAGFKAFLAQQYAAGTPVMIICPLATATTESVAGQTLQVQAGDNTLEITQASISGLELEAEYEQGVQASVQEIEP